MRSKAATWSWFVLGLAVLPGCGSGATSETIRIDSGAAVDAGGETPRLPVGDSNGNGQDAADAIQPVPDAVGGDDGVRIGDASVDAATDTIFVDTAGSDDGVAGDAGRVQDGEVAAETGGLVLDASGAPDGRAPEAGVVSDGSPPSSSFACTLMIGILATEEWYDVGFETMVDDARWELVRVHSGFVELWADPQNAVWSTAVSSPCAQNANKPDRVIFVALNFDYNSLAQWTPAVTAAVNNIQAKYPSAKRIELMSFIRAPGNNACSQAPAKRSTITPAQDQAMAMVAAANPGLVIVAPKFEAKTCGEFSSNPPHPSPSGATAWAKMMGDYYR